MRERPPLATLLPRNFVLATTTFGPLGNLKAPGTWGSVAGLLLFAVVFARLPPVPFLLAGLLLVAIAVVLCGEAEVRLGRRDPGCVILDEFVAVPFCFLGLPLAPGEPAWPWLAGGFLLFRFFDILKPLGIRKLQSLAGGWGVVADDLAAAAATNIVLQAVFWFST